MRTRTAVIVVVAVVALTGACSSKKDSSSTGATTTVTPLNPTTTAAPPTTAVSTTKPGATATTAASVKVTTAEAASAQLFDAWKAGDKAKAKQVANDAAVNELFSHPYTGPAPTFQGCEPDGATFICSYTYEGGAMQFTVEGSAAAGYKVTKVGYIAD